MQNSPRALLGVRVVFQNPFGGFAGERLLNSQVVVFVTIHQSEAAECLVVNA